MDVLERLHQNQVYPIVLLIKFKSVKQIKEIKDPRHLVEKISQKDAKNMFESTQTLEADYKPYISGTDIFFYKRENFFILTIVFFRYNSCWS